MISLMKINIKGDLITKVDVELLGFYNLRKINIFFFHA